MKNLPRKWLPYDQSQMNSSSEKLEFLGQNCNENDVYNVVFMVRMVPSDSMEDSVQEMGRCSRI